MKYLKRGLIVVHPLLFAVFFVLALYAANFAEVSPSEIIIPVFAAIGFAFLIIIVAQLMVGLIRKLRKPQESSQPYRIWDIKKAAIIASIFLVLFFTFGLIQRALGGWDDMHRTVTSPLFWLIPSIIWIALLTTVGYFIVKEKRDLYKLNIILTILSITMVMVSMVNIIINETKTIAQDQDTDALESIVALTKPDTLPDIYYIILDRYASAGILEESYDFDNSEFLDYLSNKGFYVANRSFSNYPYTHTSLMSSLNMDYIPDGEPSGSLEDYKVWRYLKSIDYEFVHVGSWWEATRENPFADMNINYYAMPEFSWFLFQSTWAYPFCLTFRIVDDHTELQYKRTLYEFDKMAELPDIEEPIFSFAHMLVPHPPYVFDREGNYQTGSEVKGRSETVNYIDQLIFTNHMLTLLIDELISTSEVLPIIILQADEGPYPGGEYNWINTDFSMATEAQSRQKMGILNAYYLPNVDTSELYPSITPVNSFRLVFNLYFGTEFDLFPDKNYAYLYGDPADFFEITDILTYD